MNAHLDFLLSVLYDGLDRMHPEHLADLRKSGLTDETITQQKIRTVPPAMIDELLDFDTLKVHHSYVIPFPDPRVGWMDHVRVKVFPSITTQSGAIKYLQPKRSGVRVFFPIVALDAVLRSDEPLVIAEGEKKSCALAQRSLPAIGISGVEGWHVAGARDLHPDLADVPLRHRPVRIIPDGDVRTNPAVHRAVTNLAQALERRGASVEFALLPQELSA